MEEILTDPRGLSHRPMKPCFLFKINMASSKLDPALCDPVRQVAIWETKPGVGVVESFHFDTQHYTRRKKQVISGTQQRNGGSGQQVPALQQ